MTVWNNVKEVACNDEPIETYQLNLKFPSSLQSFTVSFNSVFTYLII